MHRCNFCRTVIDTDSENYHSFGIGSDKKKNYYTICEKCTVRILIKSVGLANEIVVNAGGLNLKPTGTIVIYDEPKE